MTTLLGGVVAFGDQKPAEACVTYGESTADKLLAARELSKVSAKDNRCGNIRRIGENLRQHGVWCSSNLPEGSEAFEECFRYPTRPCSGNRFEGSLQDR